MAKISDDHFANLQGAKSGPTRLDHTRLDTPKRFPWGIMIVLIGGGAGVGAYGWKAGWYAPAPLPVVTSLPDPITTPIQKSPSTPLPPQPLNEPVDTIEPQTAPIVSTVDTHGPAQRRALTETIATCDRGIVTLTKQFAAPKKVIASSRAELAEADKAQWPKPGGHLPYEQALVEEWKKAKAAKNGQRAFEIEGKLTEYRENRPKTLTLITHEQSVIDSLTKRIAAEHARRAQAVADLAVLP